MNLQNITADKLVALYQNRDLSVTEVITSVFEEIERTDKERPGIHDSLQGHGA